MKWSYALFSKISNYSWNAGLSNLKWVIFKIFFGLLRIYELYISYVSWCGSSIEHDQTCRFVSSEFERQGSTQAIVPGR